MKRETKIALIQDVGILVCGYIIYNRHKNRQEEKLAALKASGAVPADYVFPKKHYIRNTILCIALIILLISVAGSLWTNARVAGLETRTSYAHQELKNMVDGGMTDEEIIWVDSWDNK